MDITQREKVIELFDFYGSLLTDKQQAYFKQYYFDDLSLAEIATNYSISRNAVHDQIKLSIANMVGYDDKLKLINKEAKIMALLEETDEDIKKRIIEIINE